jgi:hypothetical protein
MKPGLNPMLLIAVILLLLSGCASAPQHLSQEDRQKIKKVAIVSLVPEKVTFSKVMMVGAEHAGFNLGGQVTDAVNLISQNRIAQAYPDWVIKNVEYDRAALLAKVKAGKGFASSQVREAFARLADDNDLDAILVVRAAADKMDDVRQEFTESYLREGLNVLLKNNNFGGVSELYILANLGVTIIGRDGEVMATGAIPAMQVAGGPLNLDDYDVRNDMKHNLRPEVVAKLGGGVIADLTRRLNLCFDSLGFPGKPAPGPESAKTTSQSGVMHAVPSKADSFDLCFNRCRQYTDRTKGQCFDACNK